MLNPDCFINYTIKTDFSNLVDVKKPPDDTIRRLIN